MPARVNRLFFGVMMFTACRGKADPAAVLVPAPVLRIDSSYVAGTPTAPELDTLTSLSAGGNTSCLTTRSGRAACWGEITSRGFEPVLGPDGRPALLKVLSASNRGACGISQDDQPWCDYRLRGGAVDSAGNREEVPAPCRFGLCLLPTPHRGALTVPIRAISRGFHHACVLDRAGAAYCWGHPQLLGAMHPRIDTLGGQPADVRGPVAVSGDLRFRIIAAGGSVTCGVTLLRQLLFCWGRPAPGFELDSAQNVACRSARSAACGVILPRPMLPDSLPGLRVRPAEVRFAAVDVGYSVVCAATTEGQVFCWGENRRCVLGRCRMDSPRAGAWIPIPGRVVEVGAGNAHACARTADGRIFCWGDNTVGQLGSLVSVNAGPDGLPPDYRKPSPDPRRGYWDDPCFQGGRCSPAAVEVGPGRNWSALTVGGDHACALDATDARVYCWGGTNAAVVGNADGMVDCINRSPEIPDRTCVAAPVPMRLLGSLLVSSVTVPPLAIGRWRGPLAETKVEVTRDELRAIFPPDSSPEWGWPALTADFRGGAYGWSVQADGMDGPVYVSLMLHHTDSTAQPFPSQESVVAAATAGLCRSGMVLTCRYELVQAMVQNGSVVLRLRDSATIARLFGLRQARVVVGRVTPYDTDWVPGDSVAVHYLDPQIPPPDSATLMDAARSRRQYQASITSISRQISTRESPFYGSFWLAVGDSLTLQVVETHCHHDVCTSQGGVADSGWSLGDSTIAVLRAPCLGANQSRRVGDRTCVVVHGRRVGRTTVRVHGLHGSADTIASRTVPHRNLEARLVVGRPVNRIRLIRVPEVVRVNEPVVFRAQAVDRAGRVVPDVPIQVQVDMGTYQTVQSVPATPIRFPIPGQRRIVARFRELADTSLVTVIAR